MRLFTLLFSLLILSLQAVAQETGFYRVKNHYTERYINVVDNRGSIDATTTDADLGAIKTIRGFENVVSNAGSIIYIEKKSGNSYNLHAQGVNTYGIINYYVKLRSSRTVKGAYLAYAEAAGMVKYLSDEYGDDDEGVVQTTFDKSRDWYLLPVTADGDNYFGLAPKIQTNEGYYQTFYSSFAYQLPSNMKAYYVDLINKDKAVLKEVKNGLVPAATPVIIQSTSSAASSNKLSLLASASNKVSGNLLKGVYFNNKKPKKHNNQVAYDSQTMRVLGKMANGKLGFIVDPALDFIPANSAYISVSADAPKEIALISQAEYEEQYAASYTITYMVDGKVFNQQTVKEGKAITPPAAPEKEGYTFTGWSGLPENMPSGNISVEAQYKINSYTITYLVDGKQYATQTIEYGANITAPKAPEKEGHTFTWTGLPKTMPAKNITVTGAFAVNKYKLTYTIDGKVITEETVEYGAKITAPNAPEKEGHTFNGWTNVPSTMPAKDVTVTGSYTINKYKLTFTVDGTVVAEETIEYGAKVTAPNAPEKEGHTFNGWTNVPSTMPAKDVTVTGAFVANKYKLTYTIDGKVITEETVEYGAKITAPNAPEKEGHTFNGWTNVPSTMPAKDVTVTGAYTVNKYKLTFIVDGTVVAEETVEYGANITAPNAPEKEGHTFSGWTNLPSTMPAKDVTVTGAFATKTYKLTYTIDGQVITEESLEYGANITAPNAPEKEGYTFNGWANVPSTMPAKDVTVTGSYTVNKYKLTFIIDGTVVAEETVEYGANITAPKAPEKEGHTFTWVDMPNTMPATDVTVIGSFVVNKYKLTYVIDGEVVIEETVEYGASITAAEGPEKEGHTFNGWTDVPSTMPASDVTITGSYTVNKYELTFIVNGEVISQETIDYGTDCAAPQMPEREGYTFVWTNMPSTMPAGDTTISGEYVINKYNLIYVIDGEVVIEETVEYGASITAAEDPEKEGHTFNGWTNVPSTMPASDVTIFGSYTVNKYKLTYILDDEVYAEYSVEYGSSITPIEVNLESDRVFNGWQDLPETMPANDVVVYGTTMVSSITNVLDTTKTFDVYSLTGKLVAKQVNQAWIKTNLKTGIYIINNKKYIVK